MIITGADPGTTPPSCSLHINYHVVTDHLSVEDEDSDTVMKTMMILRVMMILMICRVSESRRKKKGRNRDRSSRGLVPQLLANYTAPSLPPAHEVGCNHATMACAYRAGCGLALQQYMKSCTNQDLLECHSVRGCPYPFVGWEDSLFSPP